MSGVLGLAIGIGVRHVDEPAPAFDSDSVILAGWQRQIETLLQRPVELAFYSHGQRAEVASRLRQSNITLYERSERTFALTRTDHPTGLYTAGN